MSDSVQTHRQQPNRLPHPWDSPGKNTGVGCHFLLQCMKVKSESEVTQLCLTLSDPMDCSSPGSSIHGIFQARVLEWGAISFSDISWHSAYEKWNVSHFYTVFSAYERSNSSHLRTRKFQKNMKMLHSTLITNYQCFIPIVIIRLI